MSSSATINHIRNRNNNLKMSANNSLNNYIKFKELSNNNKSKTFLKEKKTEAKNKPSLLFENKGNNVNLIEGNESSNKKVDSVNQKYGLIELISIYNSIINKLDSLMNRYDKNTFKYIYYCLIKIRSYVSKIIEEKDVNAYANEYNIISKIQKDHKSKIYNFKKGNSFNSRNRGIFFKSDNNKGTKENNTSIQKNIYLNVSRNVPDNHRKIKYLRNKITNIENKFKIEELNYLFCIGEQHKKILELEKEISLNNVDNMTKDELRKYRCFPNYIKFDVIDEYNQKMNNSQKKKSRNKCYSSFEQRRNIPNIFLNEQNGNDNEKKIKKDDNKNIVNKNESMDAINKYKEKEKKIKDVFQKKKEIIECGKKNFNKEDLFVKKFFGKKKNYFISHPRLNYVKYNSEGLHMKTWKINDILETLPKKISKYKFGSKSQKNAIVVFPSSLNETVVNLEKLRVNKNFRSIEVKFEENRKVNKLKNIYNEM